MRSEWISKTVDIAPGHRILVAEFITKVRNIIQPKNMLAIKRKQTCAPSEPAKKQKYPSLESHRSSSITESCENNTIDLADIVSKIRIQITKWQRTQTQNSLMRLKEHEQFEIRVSRSEKPSKPADVGITCTMCDTHLPLSMGNKYGSFSISNWSRHVKVCILKKQQKASKVTQATISTFLPHVTNKSSQGSSKNKTMESNVDETSTHVCTSESSSGNQTTLTNPPVELSSENQQDF